jgi:predicted transcriptional regulator with HTH domain
MGYAGELNHCLRAQNNNDMNAKRKEILYYLLRIYPDAASISDVYDNVNFSYHCNANFHVGNMLRGMAKAGQIERVKQGRYRAWVTRPDGRVQGGLF